MQKYSVIVFDLGMVLIPFNYNIAKNRLNEIENNLGDKFLEFYKSNYELHRKFERGDIREEEFLNPILTELNNKIDKETFCKIFSEIFIINEDVASLLPELKKNYKLILLSNTNSIHYEYGYKDYHFLKHFDKLILSHEARAVKPEEKIYRTVEEFTNRPSNEHFFIDDIEEYVNGAKLCGWNGTQFINYEKLVRELKEENILY